MAANLYTAGERIVIRFLRVVLTVLVMVMLTSPTHALAQQQPPPTQSTTCSQYAGLLHRLAGCMRDSIDSTAQGFFAQFGAMLTNVIGAFLTLAVIVYGVMLAWGLVEKVGRDTFVLLLKISAVMYFVANSQVIFDLTTEVMDGAATAVVMYTPPSSLLLDASGTTTTQTTCMSALINDMAQINPDKRPIAPWLAVDCLMDTVIGIKGGLSGLQKQFKYDGPWFNPKYDDPNPSKTNPGLARGFIFFFTSSLQTSILGIVLAVAGFTFVIALVLLVIRSFFMYITGYMGLAFLTIISPLIIPLILLPQTKQYFDKWAKLLFTFMLQPVLTLVYVIFMLTAVDLAVYSGSYSFIYRVAGDASRQPNFDINYYLTAYRDPTTGQLDPKQGDDHNPNSLQIIGKNPVPLFQVKGDNPSSPGQQSTDKGGAAPGLLNSDCLKSLVKKDPNGPIAKACGTAYDIAMSMNKVNWLLMARTRTPKVKMPDGSSPPDDAALQRQIANEVVASVLFACVVIFVLNGLTKLIPTLLIDVLGDVGQTPNLMQAAGGIGGAGGGMGGLKDAFSNIANKAKSAITGKP